MTSEAAAWQREYREDPKVAEANRRQRRAYYAANREREQARQRAYDREHRAEIAEKRRAYGQANRERINHRRLLNRVPADVQRRIAEMAAERFGPETIARCQGVTVKQVQAVLAEYREKGPAAWVQLGRKT